MDLLSGLVWKVMLLRSQSSCFKVKIAFQQVRIGDGLKMGQIERRICFSG